MVNIGDTDITSLNQDNPFQLAKNVKTEVFCRKSTTGNEVSPKVLIPSALQRKSNSYFPQSKNRLSSLSNQLSEISEAAEVKNGPVANIDFDPNIRFQMPVAQRYSLQNTIGPSFIVEESEEMKAPYNSKKIFVGGLPHGISEPEFKQYFSQYGEIEDWVVMYDRGTKKPRGFGFVTYADERSIDLVLRDKYQHKIKNKWIECKRATPKSAWLESNSSGYDTALNTSYTYSSDMLMMPSAMRPMTRKLSVESMPFMDANDQENIDTLLVKDSVVSKEKHNIWGANPNDGRQSYASFDWKHDIFFSNSDPNDYLKPIDEKVETKHVEDGVTTYSEIFEDCHKSDNGSDWNISVNDPFDTNQIGFPQTLPTSDSGSILERNLNKPKEIIKKKATSDLIPPSLMNEMFDPLEDESNPFEMIVDQLTEDIQTKWSLEEPNTWYSKFKKSSDPSFKYVQSPYPVLDDEGATTTGFSQGFGFTPFNQHSYESKQNI